MMFRRFAKTALTVGTMLTASLPAISFARDHDGARAGSRNYTSRSLETRSPAVQNFSRQSRVESPRRSDLRPQSFVNRGPFVQRRVFPDNRIYARPRYVGPTYYVRPGNRVYYGRSPYIGLSAPPVYSYAPGSYDDPSYGCNSAYGYAADPYGQLQDPQACLDGSYDRFGNWLPNPNCDPNLQTYPPYDPTY